MTSHYPCKHHPQSPLHTPSTTLGAEGLQIEEQQVHHLVVYITLRDGAAVQLKKTSAALRMLLCFDGTCWWKHML
jgi:hypothetical protein